MELHHILPYIKPKQKLKRRNCASMGSLPMIKKPILVKTQKLVLTDKNELEIVDLKSKTKRKQVNVPQMDKHIAKKANIFIAKNKHEVSRYNNIMNRKKEVARTIKCGTMTILRTNCFNMESNQFNSQHKHEMDDKDKLKMKWKTIQFLIQNKKGQIDLLTKNLKKYLNDLTVELKDRDKKAKGNNGEEENSYDIMRDGLNRNQFSDLLSRYGLGNDQRFVDKLFWIFDDDGNGTVDHKELAIGLEFLKENSLDDKLEIFFDICDENNNGTISEKEFYNLIKMNILNYEDKTALKTSVRTIFHSLDKGNNGEITKSELKYACRANEQIKNIIDKNVRMLKDVDRWIDSDLEKPFQTKISFSLANTSSKMRGIYFPEFNRFQNAFEEREKLLEKHEKIKLQAKAALRRGKAPEEIEESSGEFELEEDQ